jgi:hypothetical protein
MMVNNLVDKTDMNDNKKCPYCDNKNKNVNFERADTKHGSFLTLFCEDCETILGFVPILSK